MMQVAKFLGAHFIGDPITTTAGTSSSSKRKAPEAKARRMAELENESSSEEDNTSEEDWDDEDGPSNSKLRKAIHAHLKATDLSSVTNKTVRKYLEKQFDCELKERKAFLKKEVQIFLETEINNTKKKNKGGLNKEMKLSNDLSAVCAGATKLSRSQVVKALWIYIKANNLQNPKNKREIICDKKFKKVMDGNEKVTMFSMNKYIGAHLSV
eukprot:g2059.t1